jgi:hypothetical protein
MRGEQTATALARLAGIAIGLGVLLIAVAIGWWALFYGDVVGDAGLAGVLPCLYGRTGSCSTISATAREAGAIPYSPQLLWLGAVVLLGGMAGRILAAPGR